MEIRVWLCVFGSLVVVKLVDLSAIGRCLVWIVSACMHVNFICIKLGMSRLELKSIKSSLSLLYFF